MKVNRCKQSYTANVTVECQKKQYDLTIFPATIEKHFECSLNALEIEDRLLDMDAVDIAFNSRNVIVSITQKSKEEKEKSDSSDTDGEN